MRPKLLIIANNNIGSGQSGGDTIFLEFIKNWQKKLAITVFGSQETKNLLNRYGLRPHFILTDRAISWNYPTTLNLINHHLRRLCRGFIVFDKHLSIFKKSSYCYTASDFYPDFIFGLVYKIVNPKGVWLCGQYLFAPKPNTESSPYRQQPLKGWLYYFSQLSSQFFARHFADQILVTSNPDISRFPHQKVVVVRGGVDLTESEKYLKSGKIIPVHQRKYLAVFQGRLHPQKGVLELVDIWKLVTKKIPTAKLAIIGDGQLENQLKVKIKKLKLNKNITLFGFQTGQNKYNIFRNSQIVVHPAIYDSGGMSAAEAMAWGLPGVSFDLEALQSYYPQGMIKTPQNNYQQFADNIVRLSNSQHLYQRISKQALKLIRTSWSWTKRAQDIYQKIFHENSFR